MLIKVTSEIMRKKWHCRTSLHLDSNGSLQFTGHMPNLEAYCKTRGITPVEHWGCKELVWEVQRPPYRAALYVISKHPHTTRIALMLESENEIIWAMGQTQDDLPSKFILD